MRVDALGGRLQELLFLAVAEQQHVVAAGLTVRAASEVLVRGKRARIWRAGRAGGILVVLAGGERGERGVRLRKTLMDVLV